MVCFRNHTDQELIHSLKQGEEGAFDEIYHRYWQILFNEAQKRLGDLGLSEEIVQDVFIDLWTNREQKTIESLYPYLFTAVRYKVFMIYKKQKRLPRFEEPLEHIAFTNEDADAPYFLKDLLSGIHAWLTMQPEKRREIFRLRYIEEFSTKEIAEELNLSQKTVQNQLLIGQGSLREAVSKLLILFTAALIG